MVVRLVAVILGVCSCLVAPGLAGTDQRPAAPAAGGATSAPSVLPDPFGLAQLRTFGAYRSSSNNADPDSNDDSRRPIPGETIVLADLQGPGVVTHIWLTVAANEYGWPRLLRLRVYYDGSPIPSVDAPVGDFFAVGHGFEKEVRSLMVRASSSGRSRNCYWPMPFARSCRITITNEGRRRVSNLYYHVDWAKVPSLSPRTAYFHARYRQALPAAPGGAYEVLKVKGRGHYVGTVMSVIQNEPGWFGEGDDLFYVDGEARPRIEGTGTEDYFNDAWSLRVDEGSYSGVPVAEGTGLGSRMTAYRWHVVDPIPFTRSLVFDIEHKGWTYNANGSVRSAFEERADLFSSVAFWYQQGIAADQPEVPFGHRRLPHGNARQIEVEQFIDQVKAEGGKAEVQTEVFWSKDLLLFRGQGPGSTLLVPFEVPEDGRYEVVAQLAHSPDYGIYKMELDAGTAARPALEHEPGANQGASDAVDAYFTETYVAEDHLVEWASLTRGRHTLTFRCVGKNAASSGHFLGVDTIILSKIGADASGQDAAASRAQELRRMGENATSASSRLSTLTSALVDGDDEVREAAAWSLGQVRAKAAPVVLELTTALSDRGPVVRGLAAAALRDVGIVPRRSLDALIARLKDEDVNVRLMAADAIARQGPPAAPAVDALIEACRAAGEHVHALRSFATALGRIGPAATRAVPALETLARIPRVEWAAKEAIRRITGRKRG